MKETMHALEKNKKLEKTTFLLWAIQKQWFTISLDEITS